MSDAINLIDSDRYPIHRPRCAQYRLLVEQCRDALRDQALCALPEFLRPEAIATMTEEATPLIPVAHYFDGPRCSYPASDIDNTTDTSHHRHPRRVMHENRYRQILNHQIRNDSALRQLYFWPALTAFVRKVFAARTLYRSQCPHLSLSMKVACEGDADGWHFDPNDGVVSLLLQQADNGGQFEYAPYIRNASDQRYGAIASVFETPGNQAVQPGFGAGAFVFFNGNRSLHRVSTVGKTHQPRMIALLSYDQRPDQTFSQSYIDRLRSFPTDTGSERVLPQPA